MNIQRFNCISSLPATMKMYELEVKGKEYDESIVDTSCYSPIEDELAKLQPMTQSEKEQHFHFISGQDDGRDLPPRPGQDLAEISVRMHEAEKKYKADLKQAAEKQQKEAEQRAIVDSIVNKKE